MDVARPVLVGSTTHFLFVLAPRRLESRPRMLRSGCALDRSGGLAIRVLSQTCSHRRAPSLRECIKGTQCPDAKAVRPSCYGIGRTFR